MQNLCRDAVRRADCEAAPRTFLLIEIGIERDLQGRAIWIPIPEAPVKRRTDPVADHLEEDRAPILPAAERTLPRSAPARMPRCASADRCAHHKARPRPHDPEPQGTNVEVVWPKTSSVSPKGGTAPGGRQHRVENIRRWPMAGG